MKKIGILFICISIVIFSQYPISCKRKIIGQEDGVKNYFYKQADSLLLVLNVLNQSVKENKSIDSLKYNFITCRNRYKTIEAIVEYYYQGLSKRVNGAALPDIKVEDGQVLPPHGLQVIEQYLYSNYNDTLAKNLANEIQILTTDLLFIKNDFKNISILPHHAMELIQHQLIRMSVLGLSGFDTPLSKLAINELTYSFNGLEKIYEAYYGVKDYNEKVRDLMNQTRKYLADNNSFDDFNRMQFITDYLMPISTSFAAVYKASSTDSLLTKPFKGTLANLLAGNNFNADYYATYAAATTNKEKVLLGEKLFYSKALSKSNLISCASCHNPNLYFTDGNVKATNFVHGGKLQRNTPTLLYAALQTNQFYDSRSTTLEDQVNEVFINTNEFNLNTNSLTKKLLKDTAYVSMFKKAFAQTDSITAFEIRNAISSYVRSLSPFTSKFDSYLNGNKTSMDEEQINGFNLFVGKAKCGSCHFMPLFNGNIPPWYNKSESEIIGVPNSIKWRNAKIDIDEGRYNINKMEELKYAFKTPTIRNIEKTAPYMHNGVYKDLNDVVKFYNKGGGVGIGISLPFQSLPFDSLILAPKEQKALISFMNTLTDKQ